MIWTIHLEHCFGICKSDWNDFCINIYVLRSQLYKIFVLLSSVCQSSLSSLRLRFPGEWKKNIFSEKADFSFISDASKSNRNETRAKKLTLWFHRLSGRVFWADVSMRQSNSPIARKACEKKKYTEKELRKGCISNISRLSLLFHKLVSRKKSHPGIFLHRYISMHENTSKMALFL